MALQSIVISSTASIGPEGLWTGDMGDFAPPTDMAQLAGALQWVRGDLRRIYEAFASVYQLREEFARQIGDSQSKVLDKTSEIETRLTKELQALAAKSASDDTASRSFFADLSTQIADHREAQTGATALLENNLNGIQSQIDEASKQSESRQRQMIAEVTSEVKRQADLLISLIGASRREAGKDASENRAAMESAMDRAMDRIVLAVGAETRALALQLIAQSQQAARQQSELVGHIAAQDLAIQDVSLGLARLEFNLWPMLWASLKASFKSLFRSKSAKKSAQNGLDGGTGKSL